jgi:hypothetical protein
MKAIIKRLTLHGVSMPSDNNYNLLLTPCAIVHTQKNHLHEIWAAMFPEIISPINRPRKYAQLSSIIQPFYQHRMALTNKVPSKDLVDAETSHQNNHWHNRLISSSAQPTNNSRPDKARIARHQCLPDVRKYAD